MPTSVHPDHVDDVLSLWKEVFEERQGGSLEFRMFNLGSVDTCVLIFSPGWKNGVWTKGQIVPIQKGTAWGMAVFCF